MTLRDCILKTNDFIYYFLVLATTVAGFSYGMQNGSDGNVLFAVVCAMLGFNAGAMLSGFWFMLRSILKELRIQNAKTDRG